MAASVSPQTVLQAIEPQFFVDYAVFTGKLRNYIARTLEESFRESPSDMHRRFFLLGVLREEYSAYEDVGAFLLAFLRWSRGTSLPLQTLLAYAEGDAYIDDVFTKNSITSGDELYKSMDLRRLIPATWGTLFPGIDLEKCLHVGCSFFVNDCRGNQNRYGRRAYNKIKHGGMVVPDAKKYIPNLPSAPAALFRNPDKQPPYPYRLHTVLMSDADLEQRLKSIEFIQDNLRLLSGLYVYTQYPSVLKTLGFDPPHALFQRAEFSDVIEFLEQVAAKTP